MPATALSHFHEDIGRAKAIVAHAETLPDADAADLSLRSDLFRSGWMFAVGAMDAYFCDAYTDLVAAALIAKDRQPAIVLPEFFYDIKLPVRAILESYTSNINWRWRMAARKMMERENVLSLDTIQRLFNKFFRDGHRFFQDLILDAWIAHPDAKSRLFAVPSVSYPLLSANAKIDARKDARKKMQERFAAIIQRRHDCIHNCDRPRVTPQPLARAGTIIKVIQDIVFLVERSDEHIQNEFREFLLLCGCTPTIIAQAGY